MKDLKTIKISGISLPLYTFFIVILASVIALGKLPLNMVGITLLLVVLGHLLYYIGEKLPIVNSYLGGGSVFTLIGATLLSFGHVIPKNVIGAVGKFMGGQFGFLDFYIAALICGSILGMNRKLLIKASTKFIPVTLITMVIGFFCSRWHGDVAWQRFCALSHVRFNANDGRRYGRRDHTTVSNLCLWSSTW